MKDNECKITNNTTFESSPQIIQIQSNFDSAFDGLSEESKSIEIPKILKLAIESSEGQLYSCIVGSDGGVYAKKVCEPIIHIHYLKNRFVIKETISDLYLVATKGAMRKNAATIGIVSNIANLKNDKCVYICSLNEDNIPNLYPATCNSIKNITKLADDIYIVQQNELLIAVTTGLVFENMISQDLDIDNDDESFRSYG